MLPRFHRQPSSIAHFSRLGARPWPPSCIRHPFVGTRSSSPLEQRKVTLARGAVARLQGHERARGEQRPPQRAHEAARRVRARLARLLRPLRPLPVLLSFTARERIMTCISPGSTSTNDNAPPPPSSCSSSGAILRLFARQSCSCSISSITRWDGKRKGALSKHVHVGEKRGGGVYAFFSRSVSFRLRIDLPGCSWSNLGLRGPIFWSALANRTVQPCSPHPSAHVSAKNAAGLVTPLPLPHTSPERHPTGGAKNGGSPRRARATRCYLVSPVWHRAPANGPPKPRTGTASAIGLTASSPKARPPPIDSSGKHRRRADGRSPSKTTGRGRFYLPFPSFPLSLFPSFPLSLPPSFLPFIPQAVPTSSLICVSNGARASR